MKVTGFNIAKGELRFSTLTGTKASPALVSKGRLRYDPKEKPSEICFWFWNNFQSTINTEQPDIIAYRFMWNISRQEQAILLHFPYGALEVYCKQNGLPAVGFNNQALTPKKLQAPKGTDLHIYCDTVFGNNPPYWDDAQRYSVIAAWATLE